MHTAPSTERRLALALLSLDGLSIGDALGHRGLEDARLTPWPTTDDTAMALSITSCLAHLAAIDPDALATAFARRFADDPGRGYGGDAHELLTRLARGERWRELAPAMFGQGVPLAPSAIITLALAHTPPGPTRDALEQLARAPLSTDPHSIADSFGNGSQLLSSDTVPLCLFMAARHHDSFVEAVHGVIDEGGDQDTTGAIVGGIVALSCREGIPDAWRSAREPLPPLDEPWA